MGLENGLFIEFINTLGFPIAVCIALFWANREMLKAQTTLLTDFQNTIRDNNQLIRDSNELTKVLISELNHTKKAIKDEL